MKINLNHLDEWDDYLDDEKFVIKKFPQDKARNAIHTKKDSVRKARKEKMNIRRQEERSSYSGELD